MADGMDGLGGSPSTSRKSASMPWSFTRRVSTGKVVDKEKGLNQASVDKSSVFWGSEGDLEQNQGGQPAKGSLCQERKPHNWNEIIQLRHWLEASLWSSCQETFSACLEVLPEQVLKTFCMQWGDLPNRSLNLFLNKT